MPLSRFGRSFVHMQLTTLTGKLQVSTSGPSASVPEPRPTHTKMRRLRLLFGLHGRSEPTPDLHLRGIS